MKHRDVVLLSLLRQNARESLVSLSKKSFIPVSTIYEKLRTEFKRYVKKYTAILNYQNLGFTVHAFVLLKVERSDKQNIESFLTKNQYVNSVYRINNSFDFIVEFFTPSIRKLDEIIDVISTKFAVLDVLIYFISNEVAKEIFLTNIEHAALLYDDLQYY